MLEQPRHEMPVPKPNSTVKYSLLRAILNLKGRSLQATYTVRDLAELFNVSVRAIQNRVASGQIPSRDLPGRAKFLSEDLETFLVKSVKKEQHRDNK
jgi:hypothetical protein